jgi:hypothetical protein
VVARQERGESDGDDSGGRLLSTATLGRAISESVFDGLTDGVRTVQPRGCATATDFTDGLIRRVRANLVG